MNSPKVFGPIPSRRLGRSLGINNIPPKICSYSCVYCQIGRTFCFKIKREGFYPPYEIVKEVKRRVEKIRERGEEIDYLSFVSEGEPTLDINLGKEIEMLKREIGNKVAVLTNSSLLSQKEVREDLKKADWVGLKVDAVSERVWRKVNRPAEGINLCFLLEGMLKFAQEYKGILTTETMLIRGINDSEEEIRRIAEFIGRLHPKKVYISTPVRPPAESWVKPAEEAKIRFAEQVFSSMIKEVQVLLEERGKFGYAQKSIEDLLGITAVHPMEKKAVERFLEEIGEDWGLIERLIKQGKLKELEYQGRRFYLTITQRSRD